MEETILTYLSPKWPLVKLGRIRESLEKNGHSIPPSSEKIEYRTTTDKILTYKLLQWNIGWFIWIVLSGSIIRLIHFIMCKYLKLDKKIAGGVPPLFFYLHTLWDSPKIKEESIITYLSVNYNAPFVSIKQLLFWI